MLMGSPTTFMHCGFVRAARMKNFAIPTPDTNCKMRTCSLWTSLLSRSLRRTEISSLTKSDVYGLSMTNRGLEHHVDNPYRVSQSGYTLLHCIRYDAEGGESALIDGFYIAEQVKQERPDYFKALCTVPIVFRYADD